MNKPKVIKHDFPENQYYPEGAVKKQIVLHHTVSGDNVDGDIAWWTQTPEHVATCVIIARNGDVHSLFKSNHWAHHLGIKTWIFKKFNLATYRANTNLNKTSIGIEIDSWGGLVERNGKFYRTGNKEVDIDLVVDYGREIRGFRYYEKYTDKQIASIKYLLEYWANKYNISICYKPEMWCLNVNALKGEEGVWTHVSFRPDKSDCHPYPPLITMLENL